MSSKGYAVEVIACAVALVAGLCIMVETFLQRGGAVVNGTSTLAGEAVPLPVADDKIVTENISGTWKVTVNPDTGATEIRGPGFLDVTMLPGTDSVYCKSNRLMLSLKPGESATFTPTPEVKK